MKKRQTERGRKRENEKGRKESVREKIATKWACAISRQNLGRFHFLQGEKREKERQSDTRTRSKTKTVRVLMRREMQGVLNAEISNAANITLLIVHIVGRRKRKRRKRALEDSGERGGERK